jgi:hypothetical protein
MLGLAGVIAMDTNVAGVTVSVVEPAMLPRVAVIVVAPVATDVASPWEPASLLIVAAFVFEEFHMTDAVRSCVVWSEKVPVAVNCRLVPFATFGFVGVTATDTNIAGVTVSVVEPEMLPEVAVIEVEPVATAVASPWEPAALLIVAALAFEELQMTEAVRSCVVLSEKVPVAMICWVVPLAIPGLVGVSEMDTNVAGEIVIVVSPTTLSNDALMVAVPVCFPITCPGLSIVALVSSDELQFTDLVISRVLLFEYVPVAVNCWEVFFANDGFGGVKAIETSVDESATAPSEVDTVPLPQPARTVMNSDTRHRNHILFCDIDRSSSALSNKNR